jgi:hypothetical protein
MLLKNNHLIKNSELSENGESMISGLQYILSQTPRQTSFDEHADMDFVLEAITLNLQAKP